MKINLNWFSNNNITIQQINVMTIIRLNHMKTAIFVGQNVNKISTSYETKTHVS